MEVGLYGLVGFHHVDFWCGFLINNFKVIDHNYDM